MKSPLTVILTGIMFGLALLLNGLSIDITACALIIFATGIVAWTIEQYDEHHIH